MRCRRRLNFVNFIKVFEYWIVCSFLPGGSHFYVLNCKRSTGRRSFYIPFRLRCDARSAEPWSTFAQAFWILVEDVDSEVILHHEYFLLKRWACAARRNRLERPSANPGPRAKFGPRRIFEWPAGPCQQQQNLRTSFLFLLYSYFFSKSSWKPLKKVKIALLFSKWSYHKACQLDPWAY